MITAVDTNVLLDVFGPDPTFGRGSADTLRTCFAQGSVVACDVVWAEIAAWFSSTDRAGEAMQRLGVGFSPLERASAVGAGAAWRHYRRAGGRRNRVVADFLIAGHAQSQSERLLARDRGFYRRYFKDLVVVDPSALG